MKKAIIARFEFSRLELFAICIPILALLIWTEYTIHLNVNDFIGDSYLLLNLFVLAILGFVIFLLSYLYSDIIFVRNGLEITYLGWYIFRFPKKEYILFEDINKVVHGARIKAGFDNLTIVTKRKSIIIFYGALAYRSSEFLKTLLSHLPKYCKIIGIEYSKGELKFPSALY